MFFFTFVKAIQYSWNGKIIQAFTFYLDTLIRFFSFVFIRIRYYVKKIKENLYVFEIFRVAFLKGTPFMFEQEYEISVYEVYCFINYFSFIRCEENVA